MIGDFFLPGSSFIHRFDGRAKILCLVGSTASFFYPLPLSWTAGFLLFWAVILSAAVGIGELGRPLKAILPILILVAVLTPLFTREGTAVIRWKECVIITSGGLAETARMITRFSGITILFYLFFRTTELTEILMSLRWFGLPFRAALVVTVAFRYIPHLSDLYGKVRDAHLLRRSVEAGKTRWRPAGRVSSFFPTLTSVLIQAIKGIDPLSMALELKGVGRKNERTTYGVMKKGNWLVAEFVFSGILIGVEIVPLFIV